jgi:hypothetical protein
MFLKREQLLARNGVPHFACPIIAAGDEPITIKNGEVLLISRLIKSAVC